MNGNRNRSRVWQMGHDIEPSEEQPNRVLAIGWYSAPIGCHQQSIRPCSRCVLVNEYKRAWYLAVTPVAAQRIIPGRTNQVNSRSRKNTVQQMAVSETKQKAGLAAGYQVSKYAARSQMAGRVGMALRVGGRIGLRVIPGVGVALLAYDMYQFGKWLAE